MDLELEMQSGRPILPGQERDPPPDEMEPKAAAIWSEIINAMPAGWLGRETYPLFRMFCRHIVTQEKIAKKIDRLIDNFGENVLPEDMKEIHGLTILLDRQTRIIATLAYQLRLTPKSRSETKKRDVSSSAAQRVYRPWREDAAA